MRSRPRARSQPAAVSSRAASDLGVVLDLEEPEHAPRVAVEGVERVVDLGGDPADHPPRPAGEEIARLAVLEERVLAPAQEGVPLDAQRGDPLRRGRVEPEGKLDELPQVGPRPDGTHFHGHGAAPYMAGTQIDVFAKVRGHERAEQLRAAREADVLPYFRVLEGPARPVVEMEGAERIMLGSNNYLGLTGDERVIQGARDALDRFGTGLTGSRLLNGTTPLHLELEAEIAQWMGTDDAIVFTTGHQANVGTLGTILAPGDTVVADSGDHASILDGCLLSRAKLRPFRHNRMDKLERDAREGGGRQRRHPRRRRRRVLDGGRHRPAAGDLRPAASASARGSWSTRRTRPACSARAARGPRAAGRRGPRRPAHGHVLEVAGELRRVHRRVGRGRRVPAHPVARVPLHRLRRAGRGRRRARGAADRSARTRAAR